MNKNSYLFVGLLIILAVGGLVFFMGGERTNLDEQEPAVMNEIRVEDSMGDPVLDQMDQEQPSIVEIAVSDPNFSTLVELL